MNDLNLGDVVVLKSGGPSMSVYQITGNDVGCKWFNGNELVYGGFIKDELELDE